MALPSPQPDTCVLVTGASSGIGAELARALAAEGHGLVLAARRQDRLEALGRTLRADCSVEVLVVPCDLAHRGDRRDLCTALRAGSRAVVGVCNNAGFGLYGQAADQDPERLQEMVELNVRGK